MNATIELSETDLKELLAKHWKVEPSDVKVVVMKGYDGGQLDFVPPSVRVTITVPADRIRDIGTPAGVGRPIRAENTEKDN
jgi:hypothetical protein